jgi:hypothetical protein
MAEFNSDELFYLINHVAYPNKILVKTRENTKQEGPEPDFLCFKLINQALNEFTAETNKLERIKKLFRAWTQIQLPLLDGSKIQSTIVQTLNDTNGVLPIYLPHQNLCLIISTRPNQTAIVSYFQVSFSNEVLMSRNCSDVESVYPTASFHVSDTSFLVSIDFANLLADLGNYACDCDESCAKTSKAGARHEEVRDVPNSSLITDWLANVLVGNKSFINDGVKIRKKIRDEINHFNALLPFRRSG